MSKRMNDSARLLGWKRKAATFVTKIWSRYEQGFVFLAAKKCDRWNEQSFPIDQTLEGRVYEFLKNHSRTEHDLYFCPNAFNKPYRRNKLALPSSYAWVDIDDADPDEFHPQPGILIRTSPQRFQGLWMFKEEIPPKEAEIYSKALAYNHGADKNGWSVTKYLRLPHTFNHKPEYNRPFVTMLKESWRRKPRIAIQISIDDWKASSAPVVIVDGNNSDDWKPVYEKYKDKLHVRVQHLIRTKEAYNFEKDRSKCVFEVIAGLHNAGADVEEIAAVVRVNPYFVSKHGWDDERLAEEIARVLSKLGDDDAS